MAAEALKVLQAVAIGLSDDAHWIVGLFIAAGMLPIAIVN